MKIIHYRSEHREYFALLNKAWLQKYFEVEPLDELVLSQPEAAILQKGGQILFAEHEGKIIGTIALIALTSGIYELAKMAVDEAYQGMGAGKLLCAAAIEKAKELNASRLILFTNSRLKPAIHIYHQLGFKEVPLEEKVFKRADIRMELLLEHKRMSRWFDRKFDFSFEVDEYDNLLLRLRQAPHLLERQLSAISEQVLTLKPEGKWSIKENVGHLIVLEPLWRTRFKEIKQRRNEMSPADLNNTSTEKARFNKEALQDLLQIFSFERSLTITLLKNAERVDLSNKSIHPRLKQPMRMVDMMYFVAEHDQHHLGMIDNIITLADN